MLGVALSKRVSRRMSQSQVATKKMVTNEAHAAIATLSNQISLQHEATNKLMEVQFTSVKENFERLHAAIAEVKADNQKENAEIRDTVEDNRKLADDRHLALVKKVWTGVGVLTVVGVIAEVLIQLVWLKH